MELILAVDLKGGLVVHGKSGNRDEYAPLTWGLSPSAEPLLYIRNMQPEYLYVADLDRITGTGSHDGIMKQAAPLVSRCYLDRGCRSPDDFLEVPGIENVVGTETAHENIRRYTRGFLSLDIKNGKTIPEGNDPVPALKAADGYGFSGCIVLNISAVGTEEGLSEDVLVRMRNAYGKTLLYGGGVRDERDLARLADAGFDGAILATAVHRGTIPLDLIRRGTWSS